LIIEQTSWTKGETKVVGPMIDVDFVCENGKKGRWLVTGSYRRNRSRIEKMIQDNPRVEEYLLLAVLEARKGYWNRAQTAVQKALELDGDHAGAKLLLAQILEAKGELREAGVMYQECFHRHRQFSKGAREYARYLITHTDSLTLAQNVLFHSLEWNPKDAIAHTLLAEIYLLRGKTGQALLHLRLAAQYYQANPLYHQRKAKVFMEMNRYEEAAEQLKQALRMDPKNKIIRSQFDMVKKATKTPKIFFFWKKWVI
jgi:tetratricopeptide (TPR) repeat protein